MSNHCAHCGTTTGYYDAKFDTIRGTVHLHTECVERYRAENPGFNSPALAPLPERCACCNYVMHRSDRTYARGSYVHYSCASAYRLRMDRPSYALYQERRAEQARAELAGTAVALSVLALFKIFD